MLNQLFDLSNFFFNPHIVPHAVCALIALFFGILVISADRRSLINIAYFLLCINFFLWLGFRVIFMSANNPVIALLWIKIAWIGFSFLSASTYFLSVAWCNDQRQKRFILPAYILMAVFVIIAWSNGLLSGDAALKFSWGYYASIGPLAPIFISSWGLLGLFGFINIYKAYQEKGLSLLETKRRKIMLYIWSIGYLGVWDYLPMFGLDFYPFGYLFTIGAAIGFAFYGVLRYHFLNVELILKRTVVYTILVSILTAFYFLVIFFIESFLQKTIGYRSLWLTALVVASIALGFRPFQDLVISLTDRFFFRKAYHYQKSLKEASQAITTILKLDDLLNFLNQTLLKTVRVKDFSLFVAQPIEGQFIEQFFEKERKIKSFIIDQSSSLIKDLQKIKEPIILEEVSHQIASQVLKKEKVKELQEIEKQMKDLGIALAIPLFLKDKLIGLLNLGEKLSGQAFSTTDLELLTTLANQTAIALENTQVYEKERELSRLKSEFVSVAAHRLRTPLSVIKWAHSLLKEEGLEGLSAEQRDLLERATLSNEKMIDLVNNLLDVTRIEEGKIVYHFAPTQCNECLEDILADFKEILKEEKLTLSFKKPSRVLPLVKIDYERIKTVFQILIENAIMYSHPADKITFNLELNPQNKKEILFSIEDTGIGIPKEAQAHIFDKFFRAKNAIKMETEGTGLGLFIAKSIIERHGGRIWFKSAENKGTTFYFTLPIK